MKLKSLGHLSEQIFTSFDGKVDDRGDYLVVRTLENPNYFWGNLLIFQRPPVTGDLDKWRKLFKTEFTDQRIYHMTFAWDALSEDKGEVDQFLKQDFSLESTIVLTTQTVKAPAKLNSDLIVRPLQSKTEWESLIGLQVKSALDHLPTSEWIKFYSTQSLRYQKMQDAGLGHWFGGFIDNKLVAGLGIFHRDGIGRFQIVCTDPAYRRLGICGTLVYESSQYALNEMGVQALVMCADPSYHAIQIYESVGFKRQNTEYGVCWWDRKVGSNK